MKLKLIYSTIIVLLIFSANCFSQDSDSIFNKAKYYYENEEYRLAIPYFSKYIKTNPGSYKTYQLRGNCYLETGQNTNAIHDYLFALNLKNDKDLIYNLGSAYEKSDQGDSAAYYFHRYISLVPDRPEGYVRLCILFLYSSPELSDSAIYYASKAIKTEPGNIVNLNLLALAYYTDDQFENALETARIGLAIDSSFSLLNRTAGISCFFLRDYSSAVTYFDRAFKNNPADYTLLDYKIQSILLGNTDADQISFQSTERFTFREISSANMKSIEKNLTGINESYSYKKLLQKFRSSPLNMSIDEFFMLYFGYSEQPGYSPYTKPATDKTGENDLIAEAANLENSLYKNPTDFPLYLVLADVYLQTGNEVKYFENRFKYFGFIGSIKATGNGLSPKTAFILNDISHEYSIMQSLGYRVKDQKLVKLKRHNYDVLTGTNHNNKDVTLYFNIDMPMSTLPKKARK
jgi:tetratricopeptide (TPR) repeat protein